MSVVEANKIDSMGKSKRSNELILLITDHLSWENEYEHLVLLQDKVNAYIGFIESNQYREMYPNDMFDGYVIEIHFKNDIPENCFKFLNTVAHQVEKINIRIRAEMV